MGVEQAEAKETCHGCSCTRTGHTLAEAPAKHSVSTGGTEDATGLGNPRVRPSGQAVGIRILAEFRKAAPQYAVGCAGLKPW